MSPRIVIVCALIGSLLWLALLWSIIEQGIHPHTSPAVAVETVEPDPWTTTTTQASQPELVFPAPKPSPTSKRPLEVGGAFSIASTGYCETGLMANGQPAHDGAVSSHLLVRGSRWRVLDGLYAGNVYTVEDTGPAATFDIAMPGRCAEAIDYGRRFIHIEAVA